METTVRVKKPGEVIYLDKKYKPAPRKKNYDISRKEASNGKVEPIRDENDIKRIADYFYKKGKYRNWCMFMVGINCGLRISDLTRLRVDDFAVQRQDGIWQVKPIGTKIYIKPKKTEKKKKYVEVIITPSICKTLQIYFDKVGCPGQKYYEYFTTRGWLFPSDRGSIKTSLRSEDNQKFRGDPIDGDSFGETLRDCAHDLDLNYRIGTHSLRKTFAYRMFRQYQSNGEGEDALVYLQEIFNHSSPAVTRKYIGLEDEKKRRMVQNFDCGIDVDDYKD